MIAATVGAVVVVVVGVGLLLRARWLRPRARSASDPARDVHVAEQPARHVHRFRHRRASMAAWVVGLLALAVVTGPAIALATGVARLSWPALRATTDQRRRRSRIDATAPDAIDLLVLLIHAGLTPHQAVEMMCTVAPEPIAPGFEAVVARHRRGDGLADALRALDDVLGHQMTLVVDTLAIAVRHGTPIGPALTQLSSDVRLRRRRQAEAEARRLPVRLSFPLVFCTLPSFVLVAIAPAVLAALSSLGDSTW